MFRQRSTASMVGMIIVILAAIWTLIHIILGIADVTTTDYWGIALPILFVIALILAFMRFAQERSALQASSSTERFPEPAISKFFLGSEGSSEMWFVVRMYVGAEW